MEQLQEQETRAKNNEFGVGHSHNSFIEFLFSDAFPRRHHPQCRIFQSVDSSTSESEVRNNKKPAHAHCLAQDESYTVKDMTSLKEIGEVLNTGMGNHSARTNYTASAPGPCVIILFYTRNCLSSVLVAHEFTVLSKFFPAIRMVAVDALKYYSLNTDFGILGLPTVMVFHHGRPVARYNDGSRATAMQLIEFVCETTNMRPNISSEVYRFHGDLHIPPPTDREFDFYLLIAWCWIFTCGLYYFVRSSTCSELVQLAQRLWHESEIQHRHVQ